MLRNLLFALLVFWSVAMVAAAEPAPVLVSTVKKTQVVVIPVRDEIASPILYILRRGLKEAIEQKADVVVLDMKTPGGALDVTFEIITQRAQDVSIGGRSLFVRWCHERSRTDVRLGWLRDSLCKILYRMLDLFFA